MLAFEEAGNVSFKYSQKRLGSHKVITEALLESSIVSRIVVTATSRRLLNLLSVVQCACQAGTRVQRSSRNTNNNNQQELPTAQPYGVSDSPFSFKWVCRPQ